MAKKINYYWHDTDVKNRQWILNDHIKETEAEIIKQYKKTSDKIIQELTALYDKIQASGDDVKISDLYSYERYYQSLINVQKRLGRLGKKENELLTDGLVSLYKDVQNEINDAYGWTGFTVSNKEAIVEAVSQIWCQDGKTFSERITIHKDQLANKLEETLVQGIQTGDSTEKLAKKLAEDCNIGINESRRLVRTEMAHCEIKGTLDKYEQAGVTKFRWLTASGCCDECAEKDMEVYSINDPAPPAHPNCRCTVLAVID